MPTGTITSEHLAKLRCPETGQSLLQECDSLVTRDGGRCYPISENGIPQITVENLPEEAHIQQVHYDRVAPQYLENYTYPHTQEYTEYLDRAVLAQMNVSNLGDIAEICCGRGESFLLLEQRVKTGIGVDISMAMLDAARQALPDGKYLFVQGNATQLPLQDEQFDNVIMFGGIHHVNDRRMLFGHVYRILKPGGRFYWREPVSDFFLWRLLRAFIYHLSPALDEGTERPLLYHETVTVLEQVGFQVKSWQTYGFIGFCLLMNSDVLVFNRLFRYIPYIRTITRWFARLDSFVIGLPGMKRRGLQVVGIAQKPCKG
jgi:ubiquinone/menaquinone biosynthesis C-methylase UbiE